MAGRPKTPTRELLTLEDANATMRRLLTVQVELEKTEGAMDLARAAATSNFEPAINARKSEAADLSAQLQTWYLTRAERPTGPDAPKSIKLAYGVIGERLGNPALKPLNGKWNWKAIAAKLMGTHGPNFFHPAADPAPDKDKIRAELTEDQLKACGLRVFQDEKFYIDLDRTSLGEPA